MNKQLELWHFVATQLANDGRVILLVVAESSGSSPGRAGYKMAVAANGELCGSIGGGVMEVELVERAKVKGKKAKANDTADIIEQVHQKNASNASGMICSGRQRVIIKPLTSGDLRTVDSVIDHLETRRSGAFEITELAFHVLDNTEDRSELYFSTETSKQFVYQENIGHKPHLFIVGGGHCALALSDLMSRLGFYISLFDDRPDLNTLEKNRFANEITVIDSYEDIADHVPSGAEHYVVVMTIGYKYDEIVIRKLFNKNFKYFGVLGSKAKMKTLITQLENDGFDKAKLREIHTPIGLAINSQTPDEIAVSIAAEIISVKNAN